MTAPETPAPPARTGGAGSPRIIGLDLSLTATGVAAPDGTTYTIRPRHKGDLRLVEIRNVIADQLIDAADLVIIEDLPTHAHGAGLTGMVHGVARLTCYDHAVTYVTVPPAVLKKYATGRGNATKADMRMALFQREARDLRDDNQVDARWLALMGLDWFGYSPILLPKAQRDALLKVTWPEVS